MSLLQTKTFPNRLFTHCLQRRTLPADEAHCRYLMEVEGLSLEQAADSIMRSPEYRGVNGLTSPQRALAFPRPRLCFIHSEKTAGTSLHEYLLEIYSAGQVFPGRFDDVDTWPQEQFDAARLYSGHYCLSNCRRMPAETQFITLVRNPAERILSLYYFWRSHSIEVESTKGVRVAQEYGLEEFLTHPETQWSIRDAQVRRLVPHEGGTADDACAALDSFAQVGVKEYYSLSVLLLAARFGWPVPSRAYHRLNQDELRTHPNHQRRVEREPVTPRIAELLDELTQQDAQLYRHAVNRFRRDFNKAFDADLG